VFFGSARVLHFQYLRIDDGSGWCLVSVPDPMILNFGMKSVLTLLIAAHVMALAVSPVNAAEKAKVVFISGKLSHGPMSHEHRAGNMILAKRLNESGLNVNAVVLPDIGYPKDSSVLEDADTIVLFCTGHGGHVLNAKLKEFDALMKKGIGVVMIHWATEAVKGEPADKFLEWMGGFCDLDWSVNPHWTPTFKPQKHQIWNGVKSFSVNDEWYYHMRFVKELTGVTPILTDVPGPETLKRSNGPRSGNRHVRRSVANGESQHVAWAYERPEGKGRGFGFTGGHVHMNWRQDDYRKIMLNAILWTAGVEVPKNGVSSATPSDEEMHANLDPKNKPAPRSQAKPTIKPVAAISSPPSFQQLRERAVKSLDSERSLELLAGSLAVAEDASVQSALLEGMLSGLQGSRNVSPPKNWGVTKASLAKSDDSNVRQLAQQLSQVFGDQSAIQAALATVRNPAAKPENRRSALQSLVSLRAPELKGALESLLDDKALQIDAIRAYGAIADSQAPKRILDRYAKLNFQGKRAAVETLSSRKEYANELLRALKSKTVPREDVPTYIARSLSQLLGEQFTTAFGDVQKLTQDKAKLIDNYRGLLTDKHMAKADAHKGRATFEMVCAACHQIYGGGGQIGPDLTGSNRGDIDYILLNMIDPSADVPDAYKQLTINTKDGQVLVGTLSAEDGQRLVLNTVGQKLTVLKSDIATRSMSSLSMMPEGLLPALPDSQVRDLVKYLQTTQQVELPK
jgi:putative heme-binding domain-containing protein